MQCDANLLCRPFLSTSPGCGAVVGSPLPCTTCIAIEEFCSDDTGSCASLALNYCERLLSRGIVSTSSILDFQASRRLPFPHMLDSQLPTFSPGLASVVHAGATACVPSYSAYFVVSATGQQSAVFPQFLCNARVSCSCLHSIIQSIQSSCVRGAYDIGRRERPKAFSCSSRSVLALMLTKNVMALSKSHRIIQT
ncbi:hypothetical protein BV25DRAFT_1052243 [Artomyces pyxidatus]|uniref:Uncharacterized protein n=1 Tax=Artomyces pyxidatus TaxID=48021 RepID=A0ACB8STX2_9AGAM|nr:hypothetical protein BV25DRAFT_1052243 [Artomyces pyxidatus]